MSARCERTDLLVEQCAHCRGRVDVEAIDWSGVVVRQVIGARFDGRCALDGRHTIHEGDRIGRVDEGWCCTTCTRRASGRP
jgi:hypothetical protein